MDIQTTKDAAEEMYDYEVLPDYFVLDNERENFGYSKDEIYTQLYPDNEMIPITNLFND